MKEKTIKFLINYFWYILAVLMGTVFYFPMELWQFILWCVCLIIFMVSSLIPQRDYKTHFPFIGWIENKNNY